MKARQAAVQWKAEQDAPFKYIKPQGELASPGFKDALRDEIQRVSNLLQALTPCDPEMIPGNTWAKEQARLEAEHGVKDAEVSEYFQSLTELHRKLYGEDLRVVIYETIGEAVINDWAIGRLTAE